MFDPTSTSGLFSIISLSEASVFHGSKSSVDMLYLKKITGNLTTYYFFKITTKKLISITNFFDQAYTL